MKKELESLDDAELASMAGDGNAAAFAKIYDRHAESVARILASFAAHEQETIDDLTQEVFLRAMRGLSSYVPTHPLSNWLFTIALNVGRNHVRRSSKVVYLEEEEMENIPTPGHRATTLEDLAIQSALAKLVSRLPGHLLDVVSLRIGSSMSYGEIGELLGIPEGTARSRMHNALSILRKKIGLPIADEGRRKDEQRR